jgi:RNA polymerase sigma factor (sigma-70 family)
MSERPAARAGGVASSATRHHEDLDDATLVDLIARRDERAIEALDHRFGAAMGAVANRVTRHERLAEEVVQDALLAVWRDPAGYDPRRGRLAPWLLTLTRYKAIDAVRRESVIGRRTADVDLELYRAPDDVHDEVWTRIRRERLHDAITTLGDDQRHALELAFLHGLTHVEVAAELGIPLGTAKTRIRSALLKLRAILGPSLDVDGPDLPAARLDALAHRRRPEAAA